MKSLPLVLAASLSAATLLGCQPADADKTATTPAPAAEAVVETTPAAAASAETSAQTSAPASSAPAASSEAAATAADACGEAIVFAAGADKASASGQVGGYDTCSFRFKANAGQQLQAKLEGSTYLIALLYAPGNQDTAIAGPLDSLEATLPASGEYEIRIGQVRAEARRSAAPKAFKLNLQLR